MTLPPLAHEVYLELRFLAWDPIFRAPVSVFRGEGQLTHIHRRYLTLRTRLDGTPPPTAS